MNRAFVKEDNASEISAILLPDRTISSHPNFVTESGLMALENRLRLSRAELAEASKVEEASDRHRRSALPLRDIRYFSERLRTAQVVSLASNRSNVAFGNVVTLGYDDGRTFSYRIVGEDEADPKRGMISFVSPLAQNLMGKSVGDFATAGGHEIEILSIS